MQTPLDGNELDARNPSKFINFMNFVRVCALGRGKRVGKRAREDKAGEHNKCAANQTHALTLLPQLLGTHQTIDCFDCSSAHSDPPAVATLFRSTSLQTLFLGRAEARVCTSTPPPAPARTSANSKRERTTFVSSPSVCVCVCVCARGSFHREITSGQRGPALGPESRKQHHQ
jgi:hypothetical protein